MSRYINPFEWVISKLSKTEEIDVDIPFLNSLAYELELSNIKFETYGEIVEVLEYLQEHSVVVLTNHPDGSITIKKAY